MWRNNVNKKIYVNRMNEILKDKYNFNDMFVFKKVIDNTYINLSDYEMTDILTDAIVIEGVNSDFAILLFTGDSKENYIAEATLKDLIILADIKNEAFLRQVRTGVDYESNMSILGWLCAKKILNYKYGKCTRTNVDIDCITYEFQRTKFINKKRIYQIVLSKDFSKRKIQRCEINFLTPKIS